MPRIEDYDGQPNFYTQPVRGFRLFKVVDRGLTQVLRAIAVPVQYQPDSNGRLPEATCWKLEQKDPNIMTTSAALHHMVKHLAPEPLPEPDDYYAPITHSDTPRLLLSYLPAPVQRCSCGYWGVYNPYEAYEAVNFSIDDLIILCAVEASGKVVLGTKGFRAQHLKITGVVDDSLVIRVFLNKITDTGLPKIAFTKQQRKMIEAATKKAYWIPNIDSYLEAFPIIDPADFGATIDESKEV